MKTKPRRFRTEILQSACWIVAVVGISFAALDAHADGCFVMPKFVWDEHKDINEPTQKAIIAFDSGHEDLILQVKYDGPVEEFGWLIPVPSLPTVQKASMDCFYELSRYTQKLWEPPTPTGRGMTLSANGLGLDEDVAEPVKVVEIKTVGDYEVAVLSAKEVGALENWLKANDFSFPPDKSAVLDSYVKQQWYFVAAKIRLGHGDEFRVIPAVLKGTSSDHANVSEKLASGELHPLHLRFASDKCVFPLRISSANGKPSEVQVYVLSWQPLLEKSLFEKKLPEIYSNDVARAEKSADYFKQSRLFSTRLAWGNTNLPLSAEAEKQAQRIRETPRASGELPHYSEMTTKDLSDCSKEILYLRQGSWWLTKQTWTFRPEEMQDLAFEPAVPVFAEKLDSRYGYYTAACLTQLGVHGVPALLSGLQSSNHTIRTAAMSAFDFWNAGRVQNDWRFRDAMPRLAKHPDPEIRAFAFQHLGASPEILLEGMHDQDSKVSGCAGANMMQVILYRPGGKKYIPAVQEMLKDKNSATRAAALEALRGTHVKIPREELLQFFAYPNLGVVWTAYTKLDEQDEDISNEDARPLLQNADPSVRLVGLKTLVANQEKSSVELALPLLKDPEPVVSFRAAAVLRSLTGQHFSEEQADQWEKWWSENKANFVVQSHPEELQPSRTNMMQFLRSQRGLN